MCHFISVKPCLQISRKESKRVVANTFLYGDQAVQSPYSGNNHTTWLRSCSKEGSEAVNISIAHISCEILTPAIFTPM